MVKSNEQIDRKTTAASKRRSGKEPYVASLWPCRINGCNKKFAREADLKRHQRTTKTHSIPSFICQECDASFTRTDALRRHQKSRHHELMVARTSHFDSKDKSTSVETSSSSRPMRSQSSSPCKEKEEKDLEDRKDRELPPLETSSSRYYRPHTATTSYTPSCRQTQSSSLNAILASPVSTPRLHAATWSLPPPWQAASNSGYLRSSHNPVYTPYYKYSTNASSSSFNMTHPSTIPTQTDPNDLSLSEGSSSRVSTPSVGSHEHRSSTPETQRTSGIETCIDPATGITAEEVTAAMVAVLKSVRQERDQQMGTSVASISTDHDGSPFLSESSSLSDLSRKRRPSVGDQDANRRGSMKELGRRDGKRDSNNETNAYGPTLKRPPPMEHIINEDGEPMLNPEELLTQESLASPPPS